jgi:transcriptional regulator with XRE-family HTH domain
MTTYTLWPIEEVTRKLQSRNLSLVAREAKVSRNSVSRLAKGHTNPDKVSFEVIARLTKYLQDT